MIETDVIIVGGSFGGFFAALSVAKAGRKCFIISKYKWIGGQVTSQGVMPDEHEFIEDYSTKAYKTFRNNVRKYYYDNYDLTMEARENQTLNPGNAWVSNLSFEPKVALKVINNMLEPYIKKGLIKIFYQAEVKNAVKNDSEIKQIAVLHQNKIVEMKAKYYIDASDTGYFLPLSNTDYVIGAEGFDEYNEPDAKEKDRNDQQAFTWVAAIEFDEGGKHRITKPRYYDYFKSLQVPFADYSLLSWYAIGGTENKIRKFSLFSNDFRKVIPLFSYRRIIAQKNLTKKVNEVTLVNWPQNDYFFGNIIDNNNKDYHYQMSKELTLSLIYWLQTDAPRGKSFGYPEINIRKDIFDTDDGLACAPYIRESRRIKAIYTITENNLLEGKEYDDSIGIGLYNLDMHVTTKSYKSFYKPVPPFEIPLRSLIPQKTKNLIAGCKNIGTTHLSSCCYRLHPTEANIGEVAGFLASYCLNNNLDLQKISQDYKAFQKFIHNQGIITKWPEKLRKKKTLTKTLD